MQLFVVPGSPNVRKTIAVVHHLRLDVEIVKLDFAAGDLRTKSYLAVNPNALVPSLKDGDFHLWESNAIMQYLASQSPNELFPQGHRQRADVVRWQFWETAHFNRAVGTMTFEAFVKPRFGMGEMDVASYSTALADFHRFAVVFQDQLADSAFVVGEGPTLADFSLASHLMYAEAAQIPLSDYPLIGRWYERLEALPAWQASAMRI